MTADFRDEPVARASAAFATGLSDGDCRPTRREARVSPKTQIRAAAKARQSPVDNPRVVKRGIVKRARRRDTRR